VTGVEALNYLFELTENAKELKELLKNPKSVVASVMGLVEENQRLKKESERHHAEKIYTLRNTLSEQVERINDVNFLAKQVDVPSAEALKNLSFALKDNVDDLFVVLGADINGKPLLSV